MIQAALMFKLLFSFTPFSFVEASYLGTYARPTLHTSFTHLFNNRQIRRGFFDSFIQNPSIVLSSEAVDINRSDSLQPNTTYDGVISFLCKRKDGHVSLVELQAIHNFYPAEPLLTYAAQFYNAQACKKTPKRIKAITRIGIFNENPEQQLRKFSCSIDGIAFQEFCIMGAFPVSSTLAQQDWREFFTAGPDTPESWVKAEIKTPIVRKAFDMMRFDKLPKKVKREYCTEHEAYQPYFKRARCAFRP